MIKGNNEIDKKLGKLLIVISLVEILIFLIVLFLKINLFYYQFPFISIIFIYLSNKLISGATDKIKNILFWMLLLYSGVLFGIFFLKFKIDFNLTREVINSKSFSLSVQYFISDFYLFIALIAYNYILLKLQKSSSFNINKIIKYVIYLCIICIIFFMGNTVVLTKFNNVFQDIENSNKIMNQLNSGNNKIVSIFWNDDTIINLMTYENGNPKILKLRFFENDVNNYQIY
jgi:hypothetical protein